MNEKIIKKLYGILESVEKEFIYVPIKDIKIKDDLYTVGIDSLNVVKIILALEEEFDIEFDDDDINIENFRNLKSIEQLVVEKTANKNN